MELRSPLVLSDRGHKIRTTIDKGSKVLRSLIPSVMTLPDLVSPAWWQHIAASRTMAVRTKAKYDPISAEDKLQEDEMRRLQLNKEYRVHQLRRWGIPMLGELGDGPADPDDM